jgi:hypothetical protein
LGFTAGLRWLLPNADVPPLALLPGGLIIGVAALLAALSLGPSILFWL